MVEKNKNQGQQMRITDSDLRIIKASFAENDELLKVLRKIFLPEIDPQAPIGQVIDLWMTLKTDDLSAEQIAVNLKARNLLITHVEQQLFQLKHLAGFKEETVEETKVRLGKDSAK